MNLKPRYKGWCLGLLLILFVHPVDTAPPAPETLYSPLSVLKPDEIKEVENAIDRALVWLSLQQVGDGRFPTRIEGQPAVTSLCALAFLARGHLPGEGPFGSNIERAIRFTLSCQKDIGLISYDPARMQMQAHNATHAAIYNHAISGLMLCEIYGMTDSKRAGEIRQAIEKALQYTWQRQVPARISSRDQGGWRYIQPWAGSTSDLSVTSWQLLFLRSARNAGFNVPSHYVDEAMEYIQRCFDPGHRSFLYGLDGEDRRTTRAMAGAGILSLSLGGLHDTEIARRAGDWILSHPFEPYLGNAGQEHDTRYFYGAFYCSQAMFQLGGKYWSQFYPRLARTLVHHQSRAGHWDEEPGEDAHYGKAYTAAMAVLSLSTPFQLLPIYQR